MRAQGFYWVRREIWSGEPEVAHWDGQEWFPCGIEYGTSDNAYPPIEVLSGCIAPPSEVAPKPELMDLYKSAAIIGKSLSVGGRIDIDGFYCKMLVRNPKPPKAKRRASK